MIDAATKMFLQNRVVARTIALPQQGVISRPQSEALSLALSLIWKRILILLFLVLCSALSLVYVKDLNRRLFINYELTQSEYTQLQTENNSLLLEQSAWANQDRIRQIAAAQFNMKFPKTKSIVLLKIS